MPNKSFTATFTFERPTKNTNRFKEDTEDAPPRIGSLYVQKWAIRRMGDPRRLKVTVEAIE